MLHETHPCGLRVIRHEPSATEDGLRHTGSAGPAWSFTCAVFHLLLRTRTQPSSRNAKPVAMPSEVYALPSNL